MLRSAEFPSLFPPLKKKKRVIDVLFDKFGRAGLIDTLVIIRNDSTTGQIVTHRWPPLSDHNDNANPR